MSIEAGARAGMIAPDQTTFSYLQNRPFAPPEKNWEKTLSDWHTLSSDDEANFAKEFSLDVSEM